jgi:hypothetical protein
VRTLVPNEMLLNPAVSIISATNTSGPLNIAADATLDGGLVAGGDVTARNFTAHSDLSVTGEGYFGNKVTIDNSRGLEVVGQTQLDGNLLFAPNNTYDIGGAAGGRPRNIYQTGYLQSAEIATPATPAASNVRIYPKSDHRFYALDSTGTETPLGGATQAQNDARYLALTGGTLTGRLLFSPDNTNDIGASGATRPRDVYISGRLYTANGIWLDNGSVAAPIGLNSSGLLLGNIWQINSSTGAFGAQTDNSFDIGASAANRPRDLSVGRNLSVNGTTVMGTTGNDPSTRLIVGGSGTGAWALTTQWQFGIYAQPTFSSAATTTGTVIQARLLTINASFTMANGYVVFIDAPGLGAGSAVSSLYGLRVQNQGVTGVTNAYGVYIAAQSGAATTNIGLYNAGISQFNGNVTLGTSVSLTQDQASPASAFLGRTGIMGGTDPLYALRVNGNTFFNGTIGGFPSMSTPGSGTFGGPITAQYFVTSGYAQIGSANERIRNPVNLAASLSIESADGYVFASGATAGMVSGNAYYDGTNWQRFNVANAASYISTSPGGALSVAYAPSGANPITTWAVKLSLDANGLLDTVSLRANGSTPPASGYGVEIYASPSYGVVQSYNRSTSTYLQTIVVSSQILLQIMGAGGYVGINPNGVATPNTPGANLVFAQATGPKICMYDSGGGVFFGLGINGGEFCITSPANLVVRNAHMSSAAIMTLTNAGALTIATNLTVTGGNVYVVNTSTALVSDSANLLLYATAGAVFTRASGIYVQSPAGAYVPIYASVFSVQSTRKSKQDLVLLNQRAALAQVLDERVAPLTFRYTTDPTRHLGFVAEDMLRVVPEAVTLDDMGDPQGIHYGALVPILWGAVRELSARLAVLENAA